MSDQHWAPPPARASLTGFLPENWGWALTPSSGSAAGSAAEPAVPKPLAGCSRLGAIYRRLRQSPSYAPSHSNTVTLDAAGAVPAAR